MRVCCHCCIPSSFTFTSCACVHILFWSLLVCTFIYIFSLLMRSSLAVQSFPTRFWCWPASYILEGALASLFFRVLTICMIRRRALQQIIFSHAHYNTFTVQLEPFHYGTHVITALSILYIQFTLLHGVQNIMSFEFELGHGPYSVCVCILTCYPTVA